MTGFGQTEPEGGRQMSMEGGSEQVVRLASIVAVDVVGFSAMSERDQRRTARQIETLRGRIEQVAARHEGRIFNTAGDGFMLEFSSAGSAIGAINDLLDNRPKGEPAIRVGAHVGDVVVTINNDLLGHGVNVAARLQSLAAANTALVSGEFRSMARNSPAAFQSKGRQPLENIDQRVATFAIVPRRELIRRRVSQGGLGFMVLGALIAIGVLAGPQIVSFVREQNTQMFSSAQAQAPATPPAAPPAAAPATPTEAQHVAVTPTPAPAPAPTERRAGEVFRDCDNCPEMVAVDGGAFQMGSPASERGRSANEGPVHEVTVPNFAIGRYEVTFAEWDACLADGGCGGYSPLDRGWGRGRRPVIAVSYDDAQAYVRWLNQRAGGQAYRLPSEAEWEYAARGGFTTAYAFGNRIARGQATFTAQRTDPVGSYGANAFGVFDMHGNVWEWTADCYTALYTSAPADGSARATTPCATRAYRGGGYTDPAPALRAANRRRAANGVRLANLGFRVARSLP